jgi:hypothetical protein
VWFDQSELRGGNARDQKIRKQIKDCALFVPVISANKPASGKGHSQHKERASGDVDSTSRETLANIKNIQRRQNERHGPTI